MRVEIEKKKLLQALDVIGAHKAINGMMKKCQLEVYDDFFVISTFDNNYLLRYTVPIVNAAVETGVLYADIGALRSTIKKIKNKTIIIKVTNETSFEVMGLTVTYTLKQAPSPSNDIPRSIPSINLPPINPQALIEKLRYGLSAYDHNTVPAISILAVLEVQGHEISVLHYRHYTLQKTVLPIINTAIPNGRYMLPGDNTMQITLTALKRQHGYMMKSKAKVACSLSYCQERQLQYMLLTYGDLEIFSWVEETLLLNYHHIIPAETHSPVICRTKDLLSTIAVAPINQITFVRFIIKDKKLFIVEEKTDETQLREVSDAIVNDLQDDVSSSGFSQALLWRIVNGITVPHVMLQWFVKEAPLLITWDSIGSDMVLLAPLAR